MKIKKNRKIIVNRIRDVFSSCKVKKKTLVCAVEGCSNFKKDMEIGFHYLQTKTHRTVYITKLFRKEKKRDQLQIWMSLKN